MPRSAARKLGTDRRPETCILAGITPIRLSPARIGDRFRALLDRGASLRPAGLAREDPTILLTSRYLPRYQIDLFGVSFFLSDYRHDDALGFFVAYIVTGLGAGKEVTIHPRIVYKDSSLIWRTASHFVHDYKEYWIGKGDVRAVQRADGVYMCTAEETTNLPYEIQFALDRVSRRVRKVRDDDAIELVLRAGPPGRVVPYADFTAPRRRAAQGYRIHAGRRVARFTRPGDPTSLRFVRGFEPDFKKGLVERVSSRSSFFGGKLEKLRVLSANRTIQYLFIAAPRHVWLNPPQALTTELSTYGLRVHDVLADDDLFLPGYEYHESGASQIPEGYAGERHPNDPSRADTSAWLEALPVIREFRAQVLGERR